MADDGTVVGRVAEILDAVADASAPLSLAGLTRVTGMPKPSVRRIAASLVDRGMLDRAPRGYVLGSRLLRYGLHAVIRDPVMLTSRPYVHDLHHRSGGEVAWLTVMQDGELTLVDALFGPNHRGPLRTSAWPGSALLGPSVVLLASGRLQVAHQPEHAEQILSAGWTRLTRYSVSEPRRMRDLLADARDSGFAEENEQTRLGWSCMAAVLRDPAGQMTGAVGVTGRSAGVTAVRGLRGELLRSAQALQGELAAASTVERVTE
jgi:DNA-binding IclR family transcriptional regulator